MAFSDDPVACTGCGQPLDLSYALAEFGLCQPCTHKLNAAFIAGFGLGDGEHYERDAAGAVEAWLGDVTVYASAVWLTICERTAAWEDVPLEDLVRRTRLMLAQYHGPLPAPFGEPEASPQGAA